MPRRRSAHRRQRHRQQQAVKLLFQPGKTDFWADKQVSGPYPIWLRQIASKLAKHGPLPSMSSGTPAARDRSR